MQATCKLTDAGIDAETHPALFVAQVTEGVTGYPLVRELTDETTGYGLSPSEFSETVTTLITAGAVPFKIADPFDRQAPDDGDTKAAVTALHVNLGRTLKETMQELVDNGSYAATKALMENVRAESDPDADFLAAYITFRYAKGWLAETVITHHKDFRKLWISNDKGGQDARFLPDMTEKQIKAVTEVGSHGTSKFKAKSVDHIFYQWTSDGLKVADTDNANAMNKEVANEAGLGATIIKKSYGGSEISHLDRPARIMWW